VRRLLVALAAAALLPSTAAAAPRTFTFEGRGWGHGVGMSQYGAQGFALHGWGFRRILAHYYRGTRLVRLQPRRVRVLVAEGRVAVDVLSRRPFRIRDARGRAWTLRPRTYRLGRALRIGRVRLSPPVRFDPGVQPLALDGRPYRGALVLHRVGSRLDVVNDVLLERYLRGVVPWEMPNEWHLQALAAQAVAARSYALATLDPGRLYDLVADTRDQVYGGIRAEEGSTNRAIALTRGLVVTWRGRIALTVYSSTSGGRTAALPDGLPGNRPRPYLVPVADPYDAISPHHRWGPVVFRARTLARRLGVPAVREIRPRRNRSRRVASVEVRWDGGRRLLEGRAFARALELRSTWFSIRRQPRGRPAPAVEERAWTVVLGSLPVRAPAIALALARRARAAGLPRVRVVVSARYPTLRPGYRVVVSGSYADARAAQAAAARVRQQFPSAYARRLRAARRP
jgi:stage II sporulation protein D